MIRLWLSRETEIPVHEQLSAQILLGILSRRLKPGERLPSVRALARRISLHPNTISAVYRSLVERGWLQRRMGSGVYVSNLKVPAQQGSPDAFAAMCFEEGLARGYSQNVLRAAFLKAADQIASQEFMVIDPDSELARILAAEIGEALGREVPFATAWTSEERNVCLLLTEATSRNFSGLNESNYRIIRLNSMQDLLADHQRPSTPVLIAVVSRSASVRCWASTLLSALGFPADSILVRDPSVSGWREGLGACHIVAANIVAAPEFSGTIVRPTIFRLLASDFISELHQFVKSNGNDPDK